MGRPLAFRSLKFADFRRREGTKGRVRRYDIVVWVARRTRRACRTARRGDPGGARGYGRRSGGGMPGVWGGVHLGEGAGEDLAEISPTVTTTSRCTGTRPAGAVGRTIARSPRSPRPSRRCRRGRAPPHGCAPRWARRSVANVCRGGSHQTSSEASNTQLTSAFARFSKWLGGAKLTRLFMSQ